MDTTRFTPPAWTTSDELQPLVRRRPFLRVLQKRFHTTRKCFLSPGMVIILTLSFLAHMLFYFFSNPSHLFPSYFNNYKQYSHMSPHHTFLMKNVAEQLCTAALYILYPLAGYFADTRLGHYRSILVSMQMLISSLTLTLVGAAVLVAASMTKQEGSPPSTMLIVVGIVIFAIGFIPLLLGIVGIGANVVQLGLDQLSDSPWDDQLVFIHWYMWTSFSARLVITSLTIAYCTHSSLKSYYIAAGGVFSIVLLAMAALLILATKMPLWFITNYYRSRENPYKLVYKVTKYAHKNKSLPFASSLCNGREHSRLDVSMHRHGGPFTTEQVEDVKAFYGIVRVLLITGLFFFFVHITYEMNVTLGSHVAYEIETVEKNTSVDIPPGSSCPKNVRAMINGLLPNIIVVTLIPFQITLLRPFIISYLPGMLKFMGTAMALSLLPLTSALLLDVATHSENRNLSCMFTHAAATNQSKLPIARAVTKYFGAYNTATLAFSNFLVVAMYVNLYKFICSQSPHSTKGFLVGLSFAVTGFYELVSPLVALLWGYLWKMQGLPSCGTVYYFVNIVLGLAALLLYADTARRHQFRRRNSEPCYATTGGDVEDRMVRNRFSNCVTHNA